MRLTVGPLPSAVYWRRRAVVLGALFIVVLVFFTTCRGSGSGASKTSATPSSSPSTLTPEVSESPEGELPTEVPAGSVNDGTPAPAVTTAPAAPPDPGQCTDAEIKVTPVPAQTTLQRGQTIVIRLRIKNESNRTCSRDVGADAQEIYVRLGAQVIWSSDKCGTAKGSEVQPFTPNFEREYRVAWNGRQSTSCGGNVANGPIPEAGQYQVFGRLGNDRSSPVKLTLT